MIIATTVTAARRCSRNRREHPLPSLCSTPHFAKRSWLASPWLLLGKKVFPAEPIASPRWMGSLCSQLYLQQAARLSFLTPASFSLHGSHDPRLRFPLFRQVAPTLPRRLRCIIAPANAPAVGFGHGHRNISKQSPADFEGGGSVRPLCPAPDIVERPTPPAFQSLVAHLRPVIVAPRTVLSLPTAKRNALLPACRYYNTTFGNERRCSS